LLEDGALQACVKFLRVASGNQRVSLVVVNGIEAALKQVVEAAGVKVGDIIHAVRVAVTGKTVGPGLYDCLAILGREKSLARIARALPLCG
jgi:glutamyl/glutaminyl-tRNA synthetase